MSDVVMPRLGWTMEVGRVVEWLKRDGEPVAAGEVIFSVESDKSVTEVEALDSGVLRIPPDDQVGVELPVGATVAYITPPGEPAPFELAGNAAVVPFPEGTRPQPAPAASGRSAAARRNG
ncbi:MAG: dihydrolipoamide acetyltransferase, partial [Chloroflexia bacterium]|nr:dihydrolipoamide acetyltransferase [Chloroflexia bacterium]